MLDFDKFYQGLLNRTDYFDNYWDQFPKGRLLRFKDKTLPLLKDNIKRKDVKGLECILAIIYNDGADKDYTDFLMRVLDESWHVSEEDVVEILEITKDAKSVDKLYEVAINIPAYDDMRALAKKCMWALSAINSPEAISKLRLLKKNDDQIIRENATFQLEQVLNKS